MTEAAKKPEPTKPMAGKGEASVAKFNMSGSPVGVVPSEPVDHKKALEEAAKHVQSTVPLGMDDGDALEVGRDVEARYIPPPPAPSVLEQLDAMKEKKNDKPAAQPASHGRAAAHAS